jgi:hypothetical protein
MSDITTRLVAIPDQLDYQIALEAHRGTSFVPENRAKQRQQEYSDHVNSLYAALLPLAQSDRQRATLDAEIDRYRVAYLAKLTAYLSSQRGLVSAMIAGPSNFPARRMEKKGDAVHKRLNEMLEWDSRARAAVQRAVLDARAPAAKEDDEFRLLIRDISGSLATIRSIDRGEQCWTRSAFVNSIVGKIERLAASGNVGIVTRAIAWLRENNRDPQSGKLALAERNKIWELQVVAEQAQARSAERVEKEPERIAECGGVELWADYRIDRVQLVFPTKPDEQTRETLKRAGWKWSPINEAWQRQLTVAGLEAGKRFMDSMTATRV